MSHVAKIEIEIRDIDALKLACDQLGLELMAGRRHFAWYGEHVGDYPIPEGFTAEDMGKCDHAIRVPGARYEVGVIKRNGKYLLLWDFYSRGGLEQVLGKGACRLKQAYSVERVRREARLKGYHLHERKTEQGIRMVLTK
jgi:hypothetical protein